MEENRKSSDAALAALEEAAAEFLIAGKLPSLRQRVQNGRSAASAALARPKKERPADALPNALAALNSTIDAVGDAAVDDIALATELSPETGGLLALARGSWTLRAAAGDVSLPLSGLVAGKRPATPTGRDRLATGIDRIDRIWADLMLVGDTPSSAPALRRAFATARAEYFGSGRTVRDHMLKAAYGEAPYDLTLDEWRKSAVAANASLIAIRDAAPGGSPAEDPRRPRQRPALHAGGGGADHRRGRPCRVDQHQLPAHHRPADHCRSRGDECAGRR